MSADPDRRAVFVKHHGTNVKADWQRVTALFDYAARVPGLAAPRPLSLDTQAQTINYEFIDGLTPSYAAARGDPVKAQRLGDALARFHAAACVDTAHAQPELLSYALDASEASLVLQRLPCAFFLGDAWHGNLFFRDNGDIIVLDPLPNDLFFPVAPACANAVLDIATLYMSFYVCHPLVHSVRLEIAQARAMADGALDAYLSYFEAPGLAPLVRKVGGHIARTHVDGFQQRIAWPFGRIKAYYGRRILDTSYP